MTGHRKGDPFADKEGLALAMQQTHRIENVLPFEAGQEGRQVGVLQGVTADGQRRRADVLANLRVGTVAPRIPD